MTRDADYERRNEALHKAILARKEADTAEDIVKRAEIFLQFLDPGYAHREMQKKNAPIPVAVEPVPVDTRPVARTEHNEWR